MSSDPPERNRSRIPARNRAETGYVSIPAIGLTAVPVVALAYSIFSSPLAFLATPQGPWLVFGGLLAVIALNGIFVAGDVAVDLLKPMHIRSMEGEPKRHAILTDLHNRRDLYVAAASMGSQTMRAWMFLLCFIPAKPLSAIIVDKGWMAEGSGSLFLAAILISIPVAAVYVIIGELIPKTFAASHPVRACLKLAAFLKVFVYVFWLPGKASLAIANLATKRFGADATFTIANEREEEIKNLIETAGESGELEVVEAEMLDSVFEFGDTIAREIMTPRIDLDSIPITASLIDVAKMVEETGHSRIPVYEGTDDQILGIVHAKDVLAVLSTGETDRPIHHIMRPAVFVTESKSLHDLLHEMRVSKTQLVVIQDEFGGTAGIVTIEDIVEEVVGEIVDEYDDEEPPVVANGEGFVVDGKLHLDDLNDEIGSTFTSDEFDTIGGYVFGIFGRQPVEGESCEHEGYRFKVEETDGRRIAKVGVEKIDTHGDLMDAVVEALR